MKGRVGGLGSPAGTLSRTVALQHQQLLVLPCPALTCPTLQWGVILRQDLPKTYTLGQITRFSCFCQPVTPASCLHHRGVLRMKVRERTLKGYKEFGTHLPQILKYSWHLETEVQRKRAENKAIFPFSFKQHPPLSFLLLYFCMWNLKKMGSSTTLNPCTCSLYLAAVTASSRLAASHGSQPVPGHKHQPLYRGRPKSS